jgi:uncharacterized protein (TIGR03032 family)
MSAANGTRVGLVDLQPHVPTPSPGFSDFLAEHDLTVAVFENGRLWSISHDDEGNFLAHPTSFEPKGMVTWSSGQLWVTGRWSLWSLADAGPSEPRHHSTNHLMLPQVGHVVGDLDVTDLVPSDQGPFMVSARFDVLARHDDRYSMSPVWVAPNVQTFTPLRQYFLTGAVISPSNKLWVTAATNGTHGETWFDHVQGGGLVMNSTGEVLLDGLTGPLQPRFFGENLIVVEAGTGRLLSIDPKSGDDVEVTVLTGVPSSLHVIDHFALVGHGAPSRALMSKMTGGPALPGDYPSDRVSLIDLTNGTVVGTLVFEGFSGPISSITTLENMRGAHFVSPRSSRSQNTCVVDEFSPLF